MIRLVLLGSVVLLGGLAEVSAHPLSPRMQVAGGAPGPAAPRASQGALDEQVLDAVEAALRSALEEQDLVGLAAAVVWDGRLAHEFHLGFADREAKLPVDGGTMFRWASISKPVTAVAAMQLVLAEQLDLDRDVRAYVPEFPERPERITARQLLCHQGGIVHYTNGPVVRTRATYDVEHPFADVVLALDRFKESPLVAAPGTTYAYTTHGYMLLGAVVQRAGGAPLFDQVRARINGPAGLTSLQPDYQWIKIPARAVGYRKVNDAVRRSTDTDVSWKLAGGGFLSTVGDLGRFAAALLDDTLLPQEARERMWTKQATADGKLTGYGLGFSVSETRGQRRVGHTGSQEKTRTSMHLWPDRRAAILLMTNSEWAQLGRISEAVYAALPAPR